MVNPLVITSEYYKKLKSLNNETHNLKEYIRDNFSEKGRDWYNRLEQRTKNRKD